MDLGNLSFPKSLIFTLDGIAAPSPTNIASC